MGARRKRKILNQLHSIAAILAVGLGCPGAAAATQQELPTAYTLLPSIELDARTAATEFASNLLALNSRAPASRKPLHVRYRKLKFLNYSRAVVVGREDVIVRVQSPGKRKAIMMVELKF